MIIRVSDVLSTGGRHSVFLSLLYPQHFCYFPNSFLLPVIVHLINLDMSINPFYVYVQILHVL